MIGIRLFLILVTFAFALSGCTTPFIQIDIGSADTDDAEGGRRSTPLLCTTTPPDPAPGNLCQYDGKCTCPHWSTGFAQ